MDITDLYSHAGGPENYNRKENFMKDKVSNKLTIGWLYPELMSTYGDRGNITVLRKRCEWRGIGVKIIRIEFSTTESEVTGCDLIFGGGAQDRQQALAVEDLLVHKGPAIRKIIENGIPGLFVCGSPQLLGHYYTDGNGNKLTGLGILDMYSKHPGKDKSRFIGNTVCLIPDLSFRLSARKTIVGFENHGGRTYLGKGVKPFASVIYGYGNNGEDKTEGAVYKNCIATYSHGPFLPKNPHIADWLITKALEVKYGKKIGLSRLNDSLEWLAHDFMLKRMKIRII
jgi:hypothetical protein